MTGRTHVLLGVAAAMPVAARTASPLPVLTGAVLGSLLPDCDHPSSTLGRWAYIPLGHRGPMHSLLFGAAWVGLALWLLTFAHWLAAEWVWFPAGLAIGYVAHLLADIPSGHVPLLWPWRSH